MRKKLGLMRPELPWSAGNLGVVASIAAFTQGAPWLDALLDYLYGNRKLLTQLVASELPGVRYIEPQASYLAWLDCTALDLGPDPVSVFLERGRVALTRGRDFGAGIGGVRPGQHGDVGRDPHRNRRTDGQSALGETLARSLGGFVALARRAAACRTGRERR